MNENNRDFNHDGKIGTEDDYLFHEIVCGDGEEKKSSSTCRSKGGVGLGGWVVVIVCGLFISAFLKGTIPINFFTLVMGVVGIRIMISVLGKG